MLSPGENGSGAAAGQTTSGTRGMPSVSAIRSICSTR